jgi:Alpha/beta hydrolase family
VRNPLSGSSDAPKSMVFACSPCYAERMINILFLPGLLGSNLGYDTGSGPPPQDIWLDLPSLATGGAVYLQLAGDGVSPGPLAEGIGLYATSILTPVYAPFPLFLLLNGFNVCICPFDWRQSVIASAASVLATALAFFTGQPFYIIGHSQGGLLARAVWKLMFLQGQDALLQRIVTICTPHCGSMEPVRFYCRLPAMYSAIVAATAWPPTVFGEAGPSYIDAVVATWPGLYELTAFLAAGPLTRIDPAVAKAVWTAGYYAGGNPFLTQGMLDGALSSQEYLLDAIPPGRISCIVGTGHDTAVLPSGVGSPLQDSGYVFSPNGDGTVPADSAALPGVPTWKTHGDHVGMILRPDVWAQAVEMLAG